MGNTLEGAAQGGPPGMQQAAINGAAQSVTVSLTAPCTRSWSASPRRCRPVR